ncbi:MAG: lactonase family protein [Leptospirillum sp.]
MTNPSGRKNVRHECHHRRLLPYRTIWFFWMVLFPLISGCGGGGGGSGAVGPHKTAYVLAENSSGAGSVVAYAFNQTNGTFYAGNSTASTGGTPVQLLFSTGGGHLFVLNSSTGSGSATGSVESFAVSSSTGAISSSPVSTLPTGTSPTSMAVDPGGNYLVIANNGSSNNASIQVASVSGGLLSTTPYSPSPCTNPYRVVFAPNATGSSSDVFYVACSTPSSTTTSYSLHSCSISSTTCSSLYSSSGTDGYWTNLMLDTAKTHLVGVGTTSTSSGFLVVCPATSPTSSNCQLATGSNVPYPSGNVAFSSSTGTEQVFIGNYLLGKTATAYYAACTVTTSSPTCSENQYQTGGSTGPDGPIFLLGSGSQVYIAATVDTIHSSSSPSSGYLLSCPVSGSSLGTCASTQTAVDPVWITLDPSGNYFFVATLSGELDVFEGASSGSLSFAASSSLSGLQTISVTFQP